MRILNSLITFLRETRVELKRVNWPSREETIRYTLIVIGLSAVIAVLLGAFDLIYTQILERFIF
ncbi:MAG: preprotein translocase subunit SecE [Candidatus Paceibacteria bacterium]